MMSNVAQFNELIDEEVHGTRPRFDVMFGKRVLG